MSNLHEADVIIGLMALSIILMLFRPVDRMVYGIGAFLALATFVIGVLVLPRKWR